MAKTSVGNLAVKLTADTRKFSSGMNRASGQTRSFAATVGGSMSKVVASFGALTGLVAAGGAVALFTNQMQRLDDVGKTASKLGIATEELTRLQFAGEQTGVAINTTNMALQRMTRRVSEAAMGTGEAKDAIKELGLDAAALNDMGPAKAFRAIADAMAKVEKPADRVRLAMKLFDSEGVALVNTLSGGSAALDEFAKTSDRLGNTVSGKAAKSAEDFNDAINELKVAIGGVVAGLATALTPALKAFIGTVTTVVSGVNSLVSGFKGLFTTEWRVAGTFDKVAEAAERAANKVDLLEAAWAKAEAGEAAGVASIADRITGMFGGTVRTGFEAVTKEIVSRFGEIESAMARLEGRAAAIFDATRTPAERMAAKIKEIADLAGMGLLTGDTARRALDQINKPHGANAAAGIGGIGGDQSTGRQVNFGAMGAAAATGRKTDEQKRLQQKQLDEARRQRAIQEEQLAAIRLLNQQQGAQVLAF